MLKEDNVLKEIKCWSSGAHHALTLSVDMVCKPIRLSKASHPITVDIVVFRGVRNIGKFLNEAVNDVKTDFFLKKLRKKRKVYVGKVSQMCYEAYSSFQEHNTHLLDYLFENVAKKRNKILLTGHGLGGAIAQCLATELLRLKQRCDVALITFGSPRAVDATLSAEMTNSGHYALRFVNHDDPVSAVPPAELGLVHTGMPAIYSHQSMGSLYSKFLIYILREFS